MDTVSVYDAKARLSELVDRAPRWDRAAVLDKAEAFRKRVAIKRKVDVRALIERGRR